MLYGRRGSVELEQWKDERQAAYFRRAAIHFTKTDYVFEQLRLSGKSYKSAVIATAHKMLKIAHALLKNGTKWENKLTG